MVTVRWCACCRQGAVFLRGAVHAFWHSGWLYRNLPKKQVYFLYSLCTTQSQCMCGKTKSTECLLGEGAWPRHLYGMCMHLCPESLWTNRYMEWLLCIFSETCSHTWMHGDSTIYRRRDNLLCVCIQAQIRMKGDIAYWWSDFQSHRGWIWG